jgi:uncharacterized protein
MTMKTTTAYVIFSDGFRVDAELARTDVERARGLMFRDHLDERAGMVFPFAVPGRYPFWMKNVRIPLDIMWVDETNRIVWIVEQAPPCVADPCPMYTPAADASYVIEVMGGFAAKHGVVVGDSVAIEW